MRTRSVISALAVLLALLANDPGVALGQRLRIASNASDPVPRAAWQEIIDDFRKSNPGLDLVYNVYDHESYKTSIRNWLSGSAPDVIFWFAGNRMRQFAEPKLLADISDLFSDEVRASLRPGMVELVSYAGRQFGVPYGYYQVGFYYRKDVLARAGLDAFPEDWNGLLSACEQLKRAGFVPFTLGSRDLWPTAAWFDYIDLRVNGFAVHRDLVEGRLPFDSPKIRNVFAKWGELIDRGCFSENHPSMNWQESQIPLYQGRAAMMLAGNYIVPNIPPSVRDHMEFAPFPIIDPAIEAAEDAPANSVHIPEHAMNKEEARRFLVYLLRPDVQQKLAAKLLLIPASKRAQVGDDRFLRQGAKLLEKTAQLAQYFDRDATEQLAVPAMKGFQEFMLYRDRLDSILKRIDNARALPDSR